MSPTQMDVYRLGLRGVCAIAALELARSHPDVVFTSGRRSREEQAHAMAENIVFCLRLWLEVHPKATHAEAMKRGRRWIEETYRPSTASRALQRWIDDHPEADTVDELAAGLLSVLEQLTDEEVAALSRHFTGDAFDVRPIGGLVGALILQSLKHIVARHGGKLLTKEGGRIVWHAQFPAPSA